MDFKEVLTTSGLNEEQVNSITAEMAENGIYTTGVQDADTRFEKMKEQRDSARQELSEKKEEVEALETKVTEHETTIEEQKASLGKLDELTTQLEEANQGKTKLQREHALEKALRDAGATDLEYMSYKLGGIDALEVDEDGNFSGLDEKLGELKTAHPKYFASEDKPADDKGYKPVDNGLKTGDVPKIDPFEAKVAMYNK